MNKKEKSECPINLNACDAYCNEKQVYPAMKYFVEDMKMSRRKASTEVERITHGAVTSSRALQVYTSRKPVLNKTPAKPPKKQTKPEVKSQLENVVNIIKEEKISDDDLKPIGDAIAEKISKGEAAPRVGSKVHTAVKKTHQKMGGGKLTNAKSNMERLKKCVLEAAEGLTYLADGTIKAQNGDDKICLRIIRNSGPTIITQYHRIGIDILKVYDFITANEAGKREKNPLVELLA